MLDCVIIGDSIAVATAKYRPECASYSLGGINTWQWNKQYSAKDLTANTVIISLGSNDHKHIKTGYELEKIRKKVQARQVFWILPHGNLKGSEVPIEHIQNIVTELAAQYNDIVLPITKVSADKIHPTAAGYKELAEKSR